VTRIPVVYALTLLLSGCLKFILHNSMPSVLHVLNKQGSVLIYHEYFQYSDVIFISCCFSTVWSMTSWTYAQIVVCNFHHMNQAYKFAYLWCLSRLSYRGEDWDFFLSPNVCFPPCPLLLSPRFSEMNWDVCMVMIYLTCQELYQRSYLTQS